MKSWIFYIIIAIGFYLFYESSQADRDDNGTIVTEGDIDAFSMQIGDCFNDEASGSEEIFDVPGVPCNELHDNEVFAAFDLSSPDFPGEEQMSELAFDGCLDYFEGFVGRDYQSSTLDIFPLTPTLSSWVERNDREVVCAVYNMELTQLIGSVKGLAL